MWITVRLTVGERSCVLRAIHARRLELQGTIQRLEQIGATDANKKIEILSNRTELECLQDATKRLWGNDAV